MGARHAQHLGGRLKPRMLHCSSQSPWICSALLRLGGDPPAVGFTWGGRTCAAACAACSRQGNAAPSATGSSSWSRPHACASSRARRWLTAAFRELVGNLVGESDVEADNLAEDLRRLWGKAILELPRVAAAAGRNHVAPVVAAQLGGGIVDEDEGCRGAVVEGVRQLDGGLFGAALLTSTPDVNSLRSKSARACTAMAVSAGGTMM